MSDNEETETAVDDLEYLEDHHKVKKLRRKMKKKMLKEKKKQKAMKNKLPQHIIPLPCSDKKFSEKWYDGRDLLDIPKSFRCTLSGPPNSGKSTCIKNIILRANPPFESILISHFSPDDTTEWDDVDGTIIDHIPSPHDIPMEGVKLLIIEDIDVSNLNKTDLGHLNRLYGYASSHKNLSICLTSQNPFDVPTCARRTTSLYIIYRQMDLNCLSQMASRSGLKQSDFLIIFDKFI